MKIVVTGASGHLGACVVPRLLEAGHEVRTVCLGPSPSLDGLDVERVPGDVRDAASLREAFAGRDALIHMAALISIDRRDDAMMREVNIVGTRNAARAALRCGIRRMVHVSSVHAYETWRLGRPLRDDDPPARPGTSPAYDLTKAAGEVEVRAAIADGLDAVIVNPVGVLGPFDHRPSLAGRELIRLLGGGIQPLPSGGFPWVDVRDAADAIVTALDRGERGKNHLLSGDYGGWDALLGALREAGGRPTRPVMIPVGIFLALAPAVEMIGYGIKRRHGFTHAAFRALASDLEVESARAAESLGFRARPLTETIADAVRWWRENGYLKGALAEV